MKLKETPRKCSLHIVLEHSIDFIALRERLGVRDTLKTLFGKKVVILDEKRNFILVTLKTNQIKDFVFLFNSFTVSNKINYNIGYFGHPADLYLAEERVMEGIVESTSVLPITLN